MENLATSLELSISLPATAFTCNSPPLPSSFPSSGGENNSEGDEIRGRRIDLDINKVPTLTLIEEEEEERWSTSTVVPRKKLRFTEEQLILLEQSFTHNHSLNPKEKEKLAKELKLKVRQVEVWFQNRRARTRLKQKEIEREFLKNWLGLLTEQNRMLRNEVELLRSMKMTDMPPSALRLCPHCDRLKKSGTLDLRRRKSAASRLAQPIMGPLAEASIVLGDSRFLIRPI